jgi:uncharacterized DUF497 family protein
MSTLAVELEIPDAIDVDVSVRNEYNEVRYIAYSMLNGRLHFVCFTETSDGIRVISFRKANDREVKRYEQKTLNR